MQRTAFRTVNGGRVAAEPRASRNAAVHPASLAVFTLTIAGGKAGRRSKALPSHAALGVTLRSSW